MSGWQADGTTARSWRSCPHSEVRAGRCVTCRAREVQYQPSVRRVPEAQPLTSVYVMAPKLTDVPTVSVAAYPGVFMPKKKGLAA